MEVRMLEARLEDVARTWGVEAGRAMAVLRRLAAGEATLDDLISSSGLTQPSVRRVLRQLDDAFVVQGDHLKFTTHARTAIADFLERHQPDLSAMRGLPTPLAEQLVAARPRLDIARDHVDATATTLEARVKFLTERFELRDATVVILGDRDMTGPALALSSESNVRVDVVDVDDRVLRCCANAFSPTDGDNLALWFADLRVGLPESLRGTADLVFTDPPYSPEGLELFLARGVQALRTDRPSRIVFCFGAGDHRPDLRLRAQEVVQRLRLAVLEIHPGFNRYNNAPAIGNTSDLYVAASTRRTLPATRTVLGKTTAKIYSRGASAVNAPKRQLPEAVTMALRTAMGYGGAAPNDAAMGAGRGLRKGHCDG